MQYHYQKDTDVRKSFKFNIVYVSTTYKITEIRLPFWLITTVVIKVHVSGTYVCISIQLLGVGDNEAASVCACSTCDADDTVGDSSRFGAFTWGWGCSASLSDIWRADECLLYPARQCFCGHFYSWTPFRRKFFLVQTGAQSDLSRVISYVSPTRVNADLVIHLCGDTP